MGTEFIRCFRCTVVQFRPIEEVPFLDFRQTCSAGAGTHAGLEGCHSGYFRLLETTIPGYHSRNFRLLGTTIPGCHSGNFRLLGTTIPGISARSLLWGWPTQVWGNTVPGISARSTPISARSTPISARTRPQDFPGFGAAGTQLKSLKGQYELEKGFSGSGRW